MTTKNTTRKQQLFTQLHYQEAPLLLANVWDAHSATIAQEAGFQALGTSSHAIAFSLGYKDGEHIPFDELLFMVERILQVSTIPVSVDFESGYSEKPKKVAKKVKKLTELGVVGINLEDSHVKNGKRQLQSPDMLAAKIKAIKDATDIFINARTDTYTTKHQEPLKEACKRANTYGKAGADGIFVPLIESEHDLKTFLDEIKLPLNVFTTPNLPDYETLKTLGVHRISHGGKQYDQLMAHSQELFKDFLSKKEYAIILGK